MQNTNNIINFYSDCISDETFATLIPVTGFEITLQHCGIDRTGYGQYSMFVELVLKSEDGFTERAILRKHTTDSQLFDNYRDEDTRAESIEMIVKYVMQYRQDDIEDMAARFVEETED